MEHLQRVLQLLLRLHEQWEFPCASCMQSTHRLQLPAILRPAGPVAAATAAAAAISSAVPPTHSPAVIHVSHPSSLRDTLSTYIQLFLYLYLALKQEIKRLKAPMTILYSFFA